MREKYPALDIAGWLINKGVNSSHYVTNLTLNKLAYFAHGYSYRFYEEPLIKNDYPPFEAWKYGPVSPDIYHEYKYYGSGDIDDIIKIQPFTEDIRNYLSEFWNNFAIKYTSVQLINKAHAKGGAWEKAKKTGWITYRNNMSEKNSNNQKHNYDSPPETAERDESADKEQEEFAKLNKSIGKIYTWTLWMVFMFFLLLIIVFVVGVIRIALNWSVDRDFFSIIAAFLAGSLGAGFGDKIFGGLRIFWDKWIDKHKINR